MAKSVNAGWAPASLHGIVSMIVATLLSLQGHFCQPCTPIKKKPPLRTQKSHGSTRLLERGVEVPLASTFMLSTKEGKEVYVEPVIEGDGYHFTVKVDEPINVEQAKNGTKLARGANFRCVLSESPIEPKYIKAEGMAGRMGTRLMAIVAEGQRGRVYLAPRAVYWRLQ